MGKKLVFLVSGIEQIDIGPRWTSGGRESGEKRSIEQVSPRISHGRWRRARCSSGGDGISDQDVPAIDWITKALSHRYRDG